MTHSKIQKLHNSSSGAIVTLWKSAPDVEPVPHHSTLCMLLSVPDAFCHLRFGLHVCSGVSLYISDSVLSCFILVFFPPQLYSLSLPGGSEISISNWLYHSKCIPHFPVTHPTGFHLDSLPIFSGQNKSLLKSY